MDIDFIRNICSRFPAVTEDVKWDDDLFFSVGNKMFCVASLKPPFTVSFKVPGDDFESIIETEGIVPAPYLARAKWVCIQQPAALNNTKWEFYLKQSFDLVKAKLPLKTRIALGL